MENLFQKGSIFQALFFLKSLYGAFGNYFLLKGTGLVDLTALKTIVSTVSAANICD